LNTFRIDADISSLDQFFSSGFHNKKINCLSTAVTKQLLASCSEDNAVKIWNFFDIEGYEKKGLISHVFNEEPLSVSMHPCGLFLAVSFSSGFKVFAIVNDKIEVLKDIQIPNCKIIKYSHGGHFLAVN
jgi:WD40 repeat protein